VTAETPLIQTSNSSVGGVVDVAKIEKPPAQRASVREPRDDDPGVGLGFHSDRPRARSSRRRLPAATAATSTTRSTGGDNNDDTVGGLLQLFPLEAIQEFNFVTSATRPSMAAATVAS